MQVRGVHGDNDGDWAGQSIGIMAQALTPLSRGGGALSRALAYMKPF